MKRLLQSKRKQAKKKGLHPLHKYKHHILIALTLVLIVGAISFLSVNVQPSRAWWFFCNNNNDCGYHQACTGYHMCETLACAPGFWCNNRHQGCSPQAGTHTCDARVVCSNKYFGNYVCGSCGSNADCGYGKCVKGICSYSYGNH